MPALPSPLRGTPPGQAPKSARPPYPRVFQHSPVLFPGALAPSGAASPGAPGLTGMEREGGVRVLLPGRAPLAPPRGPGAILPQKGRSHPGCPCPSFLRWGGGAAALPAGKGEPGELLPRDPGSGSGRKGRAGAGAVPVPGGAVRGGGAAAAAAGRSRQREGRERSCRCRRRGPGPWTRPGKSAGGEGRGSGGSQPAPLGGRGPHPPREGQREAEGERAGAAAEETKKRSPPGLGASPPPPPAPLRSPPAGRRWCCIELCWRVLPFTAWVLLIVCQRRTP